MKLSVIIPAYITSDKGLSDLVDLLNKICELMDPTREELILINDGSPVMSLRDIKYGDRVQYFAKNKNLGVAAARNLGLMVTDGEYVCFIDADDDVPNDFLDILRDRIKEERKFPVDEGLRFDIIQFNARYEDGSVGYPEPCAWGKLIRREWIGADFFDPDQLIGEEDTLFKKPGKKVPTIAHDDRIIYLHRQSANPDSLMKRFWRGEVPRRRAK